MKTGGPISVLLSFFNTAFYHDRHTLQEYVTYFTFSVITILIVIELILKLFNEIKRIQKIRHWLPVKAKVLSSQMYYPSSLPESEPALAFEYTYNVNGTEFTSTSIPTYFIDGFNIGWDKKIIEQFPEGSEPQIYYNPENPGEAILIRRGLVVVSINYHFLCLLWIGVMFICSKLVIHFAFYWINYMLLIVLPPIYITVKMLRKGHH